MQEHRKTLGIAALAFACLCITTAQATPTDRIIIKVSETLRPAVLADGAPAPRARERVSSLSTAAGHEVIYLRTMSGGADVVRLSEAMPLEQVQAMAAAMAQLPGVEYAEPDRRVFAATLPNDPFFSAQWNLQAVSRTAPLNYGVDAPGAWEISTGEPVTVAVLDTGILVHHLDLAGKLLPGYDFVDRDNDPSDPGDFVTEGEVSDSCPETNSSWHGTHVSGTIAAATNNGFGVAGISWGARILPVRVLGKCGGFVSDIVDAMRWSAGLPVSGVPANPHPSRILNLSLGGEGDCIGPGFASLRDAIRDVNAVGAVVIVAAGNGAEDLAVLPFAPALCEGVVTVAATDRQGRRAGYSGFGEAVNISAPGGGGNVILSTLDGGDTTPLEDDAIGARIGTSMATAHVSGVAALILGYDPGLNRNELVYLLETHTTKFPVSSNCAIDGGCGSGIVNAARAVAATAGFTGLPPVSSGGGGGAFSVPWLFGFYLFSVVFMHNRRPAQVVPASIP